MIKRPLNSRFSGAVLEDRKTTTIRDSAWPIGVPIMLYNWSGAAYRSKQIDVAPVMVSNARKIRITHRKDGGMLFAYGRPGPRPLHETEGFSGRAALEDWFRPLVRPGETVTKFLMTFSRIKPTEEKTYPCTTCGGDAFLGISNWRGPSGQIIGKSERLCLSCARTRGVSSPFHQPHGEASGGAAEKIIATISEIEAMPEILTETSVLLKLAKEAQQSGRMPDLSILNAQGQKSPHVGGGSKGE